MEAGCCGLNSQRLPPHRSSHVPQEGETVTSKVRKTKRGTGSIYRKSKRRADSHDPWLGLEEMTRG